MPNELKEIVAKIVSENPDVECVYSNWEPNGVGGIVFLQIDGASHEHAVELQNKYTLYIWNTIEALFADAYSIVIVTDIYEMENMYALIYDRKNGGFVYE